MSPAKTAENVLGASTAALFGAAATAIAPRFFLSAAVWICATHAALGLLPSFQLGSVQVRGSGVAIAGLLLGAVVILGSHFHEACIALTKNFKPFFFLFLLTALRIFDAPDKAMAVKEVLLLATPLAIGVVVWISLAHGFEKDGFEKQLLISPVLVLALLSTQALTGQAGYNDEGLDSSLGKGPIALFCLPILALALSFWRYEKEKKWPLLATALSLALLLLTVERMAVMVALLVLIPLRFVKFDRGLIRNALKWALLGCFAALLVLQAPSVRYRFFEHKETPAFDNEESMINTSGRTTIWLLTVDDAMNRPLLGQGTGSAEIFIRGVQEFEIDHPHNEYLRVWHDLGILGVLLLVFAWYGRLFHHFKMWIQLDKEPELARPHMAATLACLAVVLSFFTDNMLIHIPAQVPMFSLLAIADRSMDGRGALQLET